MAACFWFFGFGVAKPALFEVEGGEAALHLKKCGTYHSEPFIV